MVRHVVMIKLKSFSSPLEKEQNIEKLKSELESLENKIPEILFYQVGKNFSKSPSAFDLVLVSDFMSEKDLNAYRVHPEHVKVLDFLKQVSEKTAVVDFEV